ncbi:MAG TPA: Rap1a/Tai family immunity protein [Stellaceae bacterium]|jgi:hypothetical protein
MRRCLYAVATAVFAAAGPARAGIEDGTALYRYCSATIGAFEMYCFGYVDSVVNDMRIYGSVHGYRACLPTLLEDNQRRDIIVAFLRRNPEAARSDATGLIARALAEAFPCPLGPAR